MAANFIPWPRGYIEPDEPNLEAGWDFRDNEIAVFGYPINRSAAGATYNLNAPTGTPLVGQGGGVLVTDDPNSYHSRAAQIGVTAATSAYSSEIEVETNPSAARYILVNGSVAGYETRIEANGAIAISFDRATLSTTAAAFAAGKGPMRVTGIYDPATGNQSLMINGTVYDTDAVVPVAPNGFFAIGQHGTTRAARVYRAARTAAEERTAYVKDFARRIVWQWKPRDVGEGPAGGILTGSASGVGGWTCPLGAATMSFVQRPQGLTLTDTQTVNLNRIDLEYGSRPFFGSVLVEYQTRNPVFGGDSLIVGFTPRRGVDPTAPGSNSYWLNMYNNGGGWFRTSLYLANGAQIDGADVAAASVAANTRMKCLLTRDVNGDFQVYTYCAATNSWGWTAAVGNDVTVLSEGCVTIAARGPYVERVTWFQGAATPHELGL